MQWVRLSFFFSYLQRLSNVYTIEETRRGYAYKMAIQFYHYPKCTTCKKASKWLKDEGIDFTAYDITTDTPTKDELRKFYELSGLPLKKFFNTSGMKYRELGLKACRYVRRRTISTFSVRWYVNQASSHYGR